MARSKRLPTVDDSPVRATPLTERDQCLQRLIDELIAHPFGPVDWQRLASDLGYSLPHLRRLIREVCDEPVASLGRRIRLERASYRLTDTKDSVVEVAYEAGYRSAESFSRAFARRYGAPPLAFRQNARSVTLQATVNGIHWHRSGWGRRLAERQRPMIQPKIIPFGEKRCAGYIHTGETPGIDVSWAHVNQMTQDRGLRKPTTRYFTQCLDDPDATSPERSRYLLLFTLGPGEPIPEGYQEVVLPAGEYAVFIHQGPDDGIVDTWAKAFQEWLPRSGREFDCVCFEEYVNGFYLRPEFPDEKLIVTAVYLKLSQAARTDEVNS